MGMAFRELLLNAVEWGGQLDPNRKVRIAHVRSSRMLMYRVADPGPGFSFRNLAHAAVGQREHELRQVGIADRHFVGRAIAIEERRILVVIDDGAVRRGGDRNARRGTFEIGSLDCAISVGFPGTVARARSITAFVQA